MDIIINVTCSEIQTPAGFLYVILSVLLNHINNPDCEQSWLSEVSVFLSSNYTITSVGHVTLKK